MVAEFRGDGALLDAYSSLGNNYTGLGTGRDRLSHTGINLATQRLEKQHLESLYRSSRLIEKAVSLLPADSAKKWGQWKADGNEQLLESECDRLKLRSAFIEAGTLGRLYGDGYIVLGIDDGLPFEEPVDTNAIRSVRFVRCLSRYNLQPDGATGPYSNPSYYLFPQASKQKGGQDLPRRIHSSRVLRFWGKWLPEELLAATGGHNDSVIQALFDAFNRYESAIAASAAMTQDYNVFSYKLKGLSQLVAQGNTEALIKRFASIQMGMSTIKGLMMDADNEDANFISRSFAGIKDIIRELQDAFIAAAEMPRSKLFSGSLSGAFSEAGNSDRYEWADCIASYQADCWQDNLLLVGRYLLAQREGGIGRYPSDLGFVWTPTLQQTQLEIAQLAELNAKTDVAYMDAGVLMPAEVRNSRFGQSEYGQQINLEGELPPVPVEQVREDAIARLIPKQAYYQAAGYRADGFAEQFELEFQEDTRTRTDATDW